MMLMPIVYASEVERSVAFYETLGFRAATRSRSGNFVELEAGSAILAIHHAERLPVIDDDRMRVELALVAREPLEGVVEALQSRGIELHEPILDENFGRSLIVYDPDGLRIQINEHDHELYT